MKMNYAGKDVYLGIDVHKKKYVIAARCDGESVKSWSQAARPQQFIESIHKWFGGANLIAVYEAGFSGFVLCRELEAAGVSCIVVNPASVEAAANDRVKTDKRDAKKLAELLEAGRLKGIYVPTLEEELERQYQRSREQLLRARVKIGNQIKSKLFEFGFIDADDETTANLKFLTWVEALKLPSQLRFCIALLIEQWKGLNKAIKTLEMKIADQVATDEKKAPAATKSRQLQIIKSVPGIGKISASILMTELIDLTRFRNQKAVFRITGLTPSEHSSGDRIRKGNISRQGSNRLRWVLTEVAWRAIRSDPALLEAFERIAGKRGKKRAIVAIARRIIGRIRSCVWQNIEYVEGTFA